MVLTNLAAAEATDVEVENLTPLAVLADSELRYQLPTGLGACVPTDRYVERTFSISSLGFARLPGVRARAGASWSFDAPFEDRPRVYASLTYTP